MNSTGEPVAEAPARGHRRPIWLGALLAPWVPALLLALISAVDAGMRDDFDGLHGWPATLAVLALTAVIGYLTMLVLGLPAIMWLRARGRLTTPRVCMASTLAAAFALLAATVAGWPPSAFGDLVALACGMLAGLAFCALAGVPWGIQDHPGGGGISPRKFRR